MRPVNDLPLSAQVALQQFDERITALERRMPRSAVAGEDDLQATLMTLRDEFRAALVDPDHRYWEEVFGGPDAVGSALRLKATGPGGVRASALSIGDWPVPTLVPFQGPIFLTPQDAGLPNKVGPDKINKFNILGSLLVQGAMMASKLTVDDLIVLGTPRLLHFNSPASVVTVSTTPTELYRWSVDDFEIGDAYLILMSAALAANTNSKVLKLFLGTDAFTLVTTAANVASNRLLLLLVVMRTASTVARLLGFVSHGAADGAAPTVLHWGGSSNTIAAPTFPYPMKLEGTGVTTNDIIATSCQVLPLTS